MTDLIYSGGVRFDDAAVADVTMDKDGHPLTCKNPITGEELGGGGSSDFSTAEVTIINNTQDRINGNQFPCYIEENEVEEGSPAAITTTIEGFVVGETTIKVPLYKGHAILYKITGEQIAVSGDIAVIGSGTLVVSGNGTITFDTPQ